MTLAQGRVTVVTPAQKLRAREKRRRKGKGGGSVEERAERIRLAGRALAVF